MTFAKTLASAAALMATAAAVQAQEANPAVIFDLGGKFDRSFNQASYEGAERFKTETGIEYEEFELQNDAQREQALRRFAERGHNPVIVTGFSYGSAMETVAPEFPDTEFVIIDAVVDQPNVRSVVFNEHEGSYLVGVLAAMASETGKVGFVGGMDIPLIRKFACGYVQGVKDDQPRRRGVPEHDRHHRRGLERPGARAASSPRARSTAARTWSTTRPAAPASGVLQAAADAGKLGIGVDSNQNHLHPGHVLTSMLKRVDNAVYDAMMDVHNGEWSVGHRGDGARRGRRRLRRRREQRGADHAGDEGRGRGGEGQDHRRRDRGARLHDRRQLPGVLSRR